MEVMSLPKQPGCANLRLWSSSLGNLGSNSDSKHYTMVHISHTSSHFIPQKLTRLVNLVLADNQLEAVPQIPESVRTVHLQVCLYSQYPDIYPNL